MIVAEVQHASVACTTGQQELLEDCLLLQCGMPMAIWMQLQAAPRATRHEQQIFIGVIAVTQCML